jgi:hypothetical protein
MDEIKDLMKMMSEINSKLDKLLLCQRFEPDDRQRMLIDAFEENGGSLCWSDLMRFPELKRQYVYREKFSRDMNEISGSLGLEETRIGNKLIFHRPWVDPMAGCPLSIDLSGLKPNDTQLMKILVQQIEKETSLNIKFFLDDHASSASGDWKTKVMDNLAKQSVIERGRMNDKWVAEDGKQFIVGPDWFRMRAC